MACWMFLKTYKNSSDIEDCNLYSYLCICVAPLMVGAAGSAYMINDAATILPRAVVAKARAYLAGAAADVLEVGKIIFFNMIHVLKMFSAFTQFMLSNRLV